NFLPVPLQPDLFDIQGHAPRQVPHGFFVGPLFQKFSTPSRNMTDPAVLKSRRRTETPIAAASRSGTSIFLFRMQRSPAARYRSDLIITSPARRGEGIRSFPP